MLPSSLITTLEQKAQASAYRQRYCCTTQDQIIKVANKHYLNFSGNDYLGLANSVELKQAWLAAAEKYSAGSTGSALINGYHITHQIAEEKLADWLGFKACLLFSTGFSANSSILKSVMTNESDLIIQDKLNHASLIDGGLAAAAKNTRFKHNDINHLQTKLTQTQAYKLVVTEGVFSMDGDSAPLKQICDSLAQQNAGLMLDDAHGIGIFGATGKGSIQQQAIRPESIDIYTATFGKAFGLAGAFVAGSSDLIEYLVNTARSYIYSTTMSPIQAAVISSAIDIVKQAQWRRDKLAENIAWYKQIIADYELTQFVGNTHSGSNSPIQPFILGDNQTALKVSEQLRQMGFWVTAIRPPTVPTNTARLRFTLSASHSKQDITALMTALKTVVNDNAHILSEN